MCRVRTESLTGVAAVIRGMGWANWHLDGMNDELDGCSLLVFLYVHIYVAYITELLSLSVKAAHLLTYNRLFLLFFYRQTHWNVWHKPVRTGRWQTLKRFVSGARCRMSAALFITSSLTASAPLLVCDHNVLFRPPQGTNRVQSRAEGWPHHQHPSDQAVWQPAGAEPHQGHRTFLQGPGNLPVFSHSQFTQMLTLSRRWIFAQCPRISQIS